MPPRNPGQMRVTPVCHSFTDERLLGQYQLWSLPRTCALHFEVNPKAAFNVINRGNYRADISKGCCMRL